MRAAFVQTKEKAEHSTNAQENNAGEYASDRIEGGTDRIAHEAAYQFDKQGRKGLEETKENVSKAKDGIQKFKEKRAEETLKSSPCGIEGQQKPLQQLRQAPPVFTRPKKQPKSGTTGAKDRKTVCPFFG